MGKFEIPEPFKWDESFKVFYDNLDDEHRQLFDGVFAVAADKGNAGNLANLVKVVKNHFADEEGMMKSAGYGDFDSHKSAHDAFTAKVSGLSTPVDDATVNFAKDWLVNHIKGTDHKYLGKLG